MNLHFGIIFMTTKTKIKITVQDLMHIHTLAVNNCIQLPFDSNLMKDNNKVQAYSWTSAVVNWLNSKDLLDIEVDIDK